VKYIFDPEKVMISKGNLRERNFVSRIGIKPDNVRIANEGLQPFPVYLVILEWGDHRYYQFMVHCLECCAIIIIYLYTAFKGKMSQHELHQISDKALPQR